MELGPFALLYSRIQPSVLPALTATPLCHSSTHDAAVQKTLPPLLLLFPSPHSSPHLYDGLLERLDVYRLLPTGHLSSQHTQTYMDVLTVQSTPLPQGAHQILWVAASQAMPCSRNLVIRLLKSAPTANILNRQLVLLQQFHRHAGH